MCLFGYHKVSYDFSERQIRPQVLGSGQKFANKFEKSSDEIHLNISKLESFKVPMKYKIIAAYLKDLSKYRRMAFFFVEYIFSF